MTKLWTQDAQDGAMLSQGVDPTIWNSTSRSISRGYSIMKHHDIVDLVIPKVSLDEFAPKTGDNKDVIVLGFMLMI